jgi:phosphoribosylformimino-5-aminoimidazole carboxamide ribonucleotide (ProFAR) isomerase
MFLTDNIASQPGTMSLVPQVVDAVRVPVIAAGGIADGRGIAAAFALAPLASRSEPLTCGLRIQSERLGEKQRLRRHRMTPR